MPGRVGCNKGVHQISDGDYAQEGRAGKNDNELEGHINWRCPFPQEMRNDN